jgi:hypothetical protein
MHIFSAETISPTAMSIFVCFLKEWHMDEVKKDAPVAASVSVAPRRTLMLEDLLTG